MRVCSEVCCFTQRSLVHSTKINILVWFCNVFFSVLMPHYSDLKVIRERDNLLYYTSKKKCAIFDDLEGNQKLRGWLMGLASVAIQQALLYGVSVSGLVGSSYTICHTRVHAIFVALLILGRPRISARAR
jgi:hypothetical protein